MLNTFYTISNYITYLHIYIILSFTGLISLFLGYQIFEFLSWDSIYSMHSFPTDGGGVDHFLQKWGSPIRGLWGRGRGQLPTRQEGETLLIYSRGGQASARDFFVFLLFFFYLILIFLNCFQRGGGKPLCILTIGFYFSLIRCDFQFYLKPYIEVTHS